MLFRSRRAGAFGEREREGRGSHHHHSTHGMDVIDCVSIFGEPVIEAWRCDGEQDCADGQDEANCATYVTDCPAYQFGCVRGGQPVCITAVDSDDSDNNYVCDCINDCDDALDEQYCGGVCDGYVEYDSISSVAATSTKGAKKSKKSKHHVDDKEVFPVLKKAASKKEPQDV